MSLKKAFVKMGLVEEDISTTSKTPIVQAKSETNTKRSTPVESEPAQAEVDPEISEMLTQSLQEKKMSGFDYLKFISMVEKMKSKVGSEEARYQTAFSAAEELGVSKNSLLKSGEHYLDVLKEDEDDFNENCEEHSKKEIKSRESKLAQAESTIVELAKQLEQAQQDHETLKQELQEEKEKLETRKGSFQTTLESFRSTIQANVEKINQYLQ